MTKEEVLQLEKELSFQEFNNHDAYQLGQIIVDHIEKNHLKNVRIRIVLDKDIVFQYLMDGKKGVTWLDRKQKTVEKYGHSSYYIYLENEENGTYQEDEKDEKESLFYTNITLDGRFITVGENNWDLRSRHKFDEVHIDMNDIYTDEDEESEEVEDDVDSTIEDDYNN